MKYQLILTGLVVCTCIVFLVSIHLSNNWEYKAEIQTVELFYEGKMENYNTQKSNLLARHNILSKKLNDPYRGTTIINESELELKPYIPSERHAIVTMIGSTTINYAYWTGAISLIQSLREVKTRVPNIIIILRYDKNIPEIAFNIFKNLGVTVLYLKDLQTGELPIDNNPTIMGL